MTRSMMMNGEEVYARAGSLGGTSLCGISLVAVSSILVELQAALISSLLLRSH